MVLHSHRWEDLLEVWLRQRKKTMVRERLREMRKDRQQRKKKAAGRKKKNKSKKKT